MATRVWFLLAATACGRVGFDQAHDGGGSSDGPGLTGDIGDVPGSYIDDYFLAGETTSLVVDRGVTASYYDASGLLVYAGPQQPRFDHDPISGAPLGLLAEPTIYQLVHRSENLDDGVEWFTDGNMTAVADAATAPDGAPTAERLTDSDTAMDARRAQGFTVANDLSTWTCSGFVKADTLSTVSFGCELLGGSPQVQSGMTVDLTTGTVVQEPAGAIARGIEPLRNGWYRLWLSVANNATGNVNAVLSFWSDLTSIPSTGSFLAWGAQFEQGQVPTSYVPNAGTTQTLRPLDNMRLFIPPNDIATGSVRVLARMPYDVNESAACVIYAGNDRVCVDRDATSGAMHVDVADSSTTNVLAHGPWPVATPRWAAFSYNATDVVSVADDGIMSGPALSIGTSQITLGHDTNAGFLVHLQRVTVWSSVQPPEVMSAVSP